MPAEDPESTAAESGMTVSAAVGLGSHRVSTKQNPEPSRNYAWAFAVAIVAGVVCVAGTQHPFPALIVMVVYLLYGLATARKEGVIIEFSDSFYYLGFTLTLLSLAFSLGSVQGFFRLGPTPDKLAAFGQAILTTILGVVGRIWMQLFYRTTQESIEELNKRIGQVSQDYLQDLEQISQQAVRVRGKVFADVDTMLTAWSSGTERLAGLIGENLGRTNEVTRACAVAAEEGARAMAAAAAASKDLSADIEARCQSAVQRIGVATEATEKAVSAMAKHIQRLDESAIASLRTSLRSVVSSSKEVTSALSAEVNELRAHGLGDLAIAMQAMAEQVRLAEAVLKEQVTHLQTNGLNVIDGSIQHLSKQISELDQVLKVQVERLRGSGLLKLEQSVEDVATQIRGMDNVIGDIAEVVRKRLRDL